MVMSLTLAKGFNDDKIISTFQDILKIRLKLFVVKYVDFGWKQVNTMLHLCPQGSVLCPVLLILYTTPLTCLIEKHSIRHEMFADDTQFSYSESPENYSDLVRSLQGFVKDIGLWMEENKLKINNK